MNIQQAYNIWSAQYDTNKNRTRDLEAVALRQTLADFNDFENCLEIGCGTGKNTVFLQKKIKKVTAIDFSEKMLDKAKEKTHQATNIAFEQADINKNWDFATNVTYDLVTFGLVLEHIENLAFIFQQLAKVVAPNGYVYIGELHPFKQYAGTKARFETETGTKVLTCFDHHVSDFLDCAFRYGFELLALKEYFDDDDRTKIPRILTLWFKKRKF